MIEGFGRRLRKRLNWSKSMPPRIRRTSPQIFCCIARFRGAHCRAKLETIIAGGQLVASSRPMLIDFSPTDWTMATRYLSRGVTLWHG